MARERRIKLQRQNLTGWRKVISVVSREYKGTSYRKEGMVTSPKFC